MGKNILICNLTRFGDLLQTQPMINDLAKAGHKIYLLCLENFAAATSLMKNIEEVFALPSSSILADFSRNWLIAADNFYEFCKKIRQQTAPDWIINLTPTLPARLLTNILSGKNTKILGFGLDKQGFGENHGLWASFISTAANKRSFAPFNLAQMFRKLAAPISASSSDFQLPHPGSEMRAWADNFISAALPESQKPKAFIAMQPGASENRRRWPVEYFAKLADMLWEKAGICVILTGSKQEENLAREFAALTRAPFINAVGRTNLNQLAALLTRTELLVTNDTGTMHLAAGLGIKSLAFFLATAQPWDTGPFLSGCCCLEPAHECHPCAFNTPCIKNNDCGLLIKPETVAPLILSFLSGNGWQAGMTGQISGECRVWETAADAYGGITVLPLSKVDDRASWMQLMRDFWGQLFDSVQNGTKFNKAQKNSAYPQDREVAKIAARARDILNLLIKNGALLQVSKAEGQKFLANCQKLQSVLDENEKLGSLSAFWHEIQLNQGSDLKFFMTIVKNLNAGLDWLYKQLGGAPEPA